MKKIIFALFVLLVWVPQDVRSVDLAIGLEAGLGEDEEVEGVANGDQELRWKVLRFLHYALCTNNIEKTQDFIAAAGALLEEGEEQFLRKVSCLLISIFGISIASTLTIAYGLPLLLSSGG